jgi:hypothetical protein
MSDSNNLDGLYEDLEGTSAAPKVASAKPPMGSMTRHPMGPMKTPSLSEDLNHLRERIQELEQENQTLKRNIGTLYRTATNEIKRKDNQIARLMAELDNKK